MILGLFLSFMTTGERGPLSAPQVICELGMGIHMT